MPSNLLTDVQAVFRAKVIELFPNTPTAWRNVPFSPPDDLWIKPLVNFGGEAPVGFSRDEHRGALVIEVCAPLNQGNKPLLDAIQVAKDGFYRQRFSGVYVDSVLAIRDLEESENYNGKAIDFSFIVISS